MAARLRLPGGRGPSGAGGAAASPGGPAGLGSPGGSDGIGVSVMRGYARATYRLRWVIVLVWAAIAGLLVLNPPSFGSTDETTSLMPTDSPAAQAEVRDLDYFGFPLSSRTAVVQRDPKGLSLAVQAESILDGIAVNQAPPIMPVLGALPLANTVRLMDGQAEIGTTVITYLFMAPSADFGDQHTAARGYVYRSLERPEDHVIGVAGSVPARAQQGWLLSTSLPKVEIATLAAIFLLVGLAFRSVVVPLVALGASGIAVFATTWLLGTVGAVMGIGAPAELEPLLVALILGIVTDYTVFYVVGFGAALRQAGTSVEEALVRSVASYTPIIVAAGITVAAGTAVLLVAESHFFKAFGPAMAVTILVGLLISITLVPALMAILGPKIFWPRRDPRLLAESTSSPGVEGQASASSMWLAKLLVQPPAAWAATIVCVTLLVIASLPLFSVRLGADFSGALPDDNTVSQANYAASAGFAPGITSPTTLLIEGAGVTKKESALIELQKVIAEQPGVAGVIGPRQSFPQLPNLMLAKTGDAARMLVVMDHTPLGAQAIETCRGCGRTCLDSPTRSVSRATASASPATRHSPKAWSRAPSRTWGASRSSASSSTSRSSRSSCAPSSRLSSSCCRACSRSRRASGSRRGCSPMSSARRGSPSTCPSPRRCCSCRSARTTTSSASAASGSSRGRRRCGRRSPSRCPRPRGPSRRRGWRSR